MSFGEPPLTVGIDGVQVPITSRKQDEFQGTRCGSRYTLKTIITNDCATIERGMTLHVIQNVKGYRYRSRDIPEYFTLVVGRLGPTERKFFKRKVLADGKERVTGKYIEDTTPSVLESFRKDVLRGRSLGRYYPKSPYGKAWIARDVDKILEAAASYGIHVKHYSEEHLDG